MLPFNSELLEVHLKFLKDFESALQEKKNNLEERPLRQWEPEAPDYGSDNEDGDKDSDEVENGSNAQGDVEVRKKKKDDVEITLEMSCSLAAAACSITSAEHRVLPINRAPICGEGGVVRHFRDSNRAIRLVRQFYAQNLADGKVGRTGTIQFPTEREALSTVELLRRSRTSGRLRSMYDVTLELLEDHLERFEYAGWVHNLAEGAGIYCPILPLKDGEF